MSSRLTPYPQIPQIRSSLLRHQPETVPSVEELEQLCSELKAQRQKAQDRARRAEHDIKTVEDTWRRISEKEKGKSKAIDKIKRERDFTPNLDSDDHPRSSSGLPNFTKNRSHLPHNGPGSSTNRGSDPRKLEELKKKKKKRKREGGDSDAEPEPQRPRKMSPPALHPPPPPVISKAQKSVISQSPVHSKLPTGPDFNVPPSVQLLPPRPPIPRPPSPGPSTSVEVVQDFTKVKAPSQVAVSTFYTSIEAYIRNVKEEDLGFLEYTADEVEPFVMPKLGQHYLDVWAEQDAGILPHQILPNDHPVAPASYFKPPAPTWDPSQLSEPDLIVEEKGHGLLTDRVISALLPVPDLVSWKGVKAAEDAMEGRPGGSGAAAARRERLNVTDLEARIRDTMRYHGLLDHVPDFSERVDDPIATALRQAQRELRRVVATNKARKARLAAIARDRLSYQEYLDARDTIDKNITTLFSRLQKKDAPKLNKKKRKPVQGPTVSANANGEEGVPTLPPCPAAIGLSPDEDNHLHVNEQLKQLVETRRQWVDIIGSIFDEKEAQRPGQVYGLPKESIYGGVDEEVDAIVNAQEQALAEEEQKRKAKFPAGSSRTSGSTNGRTNAAASGSGAYKAGGRGKDRGDAMDIG